MKSEKNYNIVHVFPFQVIYLQQCQGEKATDGEKKLNTIDLFCRLPRAKTLRRKNDWTNDLSRL